MTLEFDKDGKVICDGFHIITMADGTEERLDFTEFTEFRHDHMCNDGPLWFVAKKKGGVGSVWINLNFVQKIDMTFNSEEVAEALQMERLAAETEAAIVGHTSDGTTVYADEVPQPMILDLSQLFRWINQAMPQEGEDGTVPDPDGN